MVEPPLGTPPPDAPPDTPPDAPNSCADSTDCPTGRPHCSDLQCVACTMDLHCQPEKRRCTEAKTCVECLVNPDCPGERPFCTASNVCVECVGHADCKGADEPLCASGACVACGDGGGNSACAQKNNALPICLDSGGCAQCGESTDCKVAAAPICKENKCEACTRDAECKERDDDEPGICMAPQSGRCATDGETIYVQGANPCAANAGQGTSASPYCDPQRALAAITANRRIIRIRGPLSVGDMDIQSSGAQITIVGQEGAKVSFPTGIGIQVGSGNVHIRGLKVSGNQTGIVVESGATIQLNRVLVELNGQGGLQVENGAAFDIANSVFAKNGGGNVGPTPYGGVFLGAPGGNRMGRFRANTVVDNAEAGVVCSSDSQRLTGVLLFNNVRADSFFCMEPTGRIGVDPRFSATEPYHLTDGSPCADAMARGEMPPDDFDGEPRPIPENGLSDCGADERSP
jgi:hypothetical protein